MSPLCRVRPLVVLALVALTGCTTARIVSKDANGGVVAIPENSNTWPFHYRDKAEALIKKDCPNYEIAWQGEVATGQPTTDRDCTETRNRKRAPNDAPYDGVTPSTTDHLRTRDCTEYHFVYRRKNLTPPPGASPTPIPVGAR